jgi:hypothetical protein
MDVRAFFCASKWRDRCAIMFEVARDWNYAAAIICRKALSFFARGESPCAESAFFSAREKIVA